MFGKKENLLGLDIGSHTVKMIQVSTKDSALKLLKLGVIPVPREVFAEGRMSNVEAFSKSLQQLITHLKIKEKPTATAISGYEAMIKKIELATMGDEELKTKMQTELGQYIPYNIDEVYVDFQVLGPSKDRPNYMDIFIVATKRDSIADCVKVIEGAGLEPAVVDVDFFALSNAFEATYGIGNESIALVDIGANKAVMDVIHQGIPSFTRSIAIGGNQITERIRDHFRVSHEEAERVKLGEIPESFPVEVLEEIFVSTVRNWVVECRRATDFFFSNFPDSRIEKIYLSGGSSRIPGLEKVFREDMDAEVEVFNPLSKMHCDPKVFDAAYVDFVGPQMAISLGLALRKIKEK